MYVPIFNQEDNTTKDFLEYKADFEELEELCMRQMIEIDK